MKIRLLSDLHLEFRDNKYDHIWIPSITDKEEILILAGDISVGTCARDFINELCNHFRHVIMICGNHEFYYNDYFKIISDWKNIEDAGPTNFHFLYNDWRILDGVRFLAGTMWTNFDDSDPFVMGAAHRMMADYVKIRHDNKSITPDFIINEHEKFIEFLVQKFDEPFDGKTVVITHHSPGNEVRRHGRKSPDNLGSAYFADIEQLIGWHDKAVLWVHGHTHRSWDYIINNTRVVCNPYGYWGDSINPDFDDNLIIEI